MRKTLPERRRNGRRIVVISNRLPFKVVPDADGNPDLARSEGGLATALHTLMVKSKGEWIGWSGSEEEETGLQLDRLCRRLPYGVRSVALTPEEISLSYHGFSNSTVWPLFHDFPSLTTFRQKMWEEYVRVNAKFAEAARPLLAPGDLIWVQDYQLLLLARQLGKRPAGSRIGHFLHIPFPQRDLFRRLPWHREILRAVLRHDLAGFQTHRDLGNFLECLRYSLPQARIAETGPDFAAVTLDGASCRVGVFPIGIDFAFYDRLARAEQVQKIARRLRRLYPGRKVILGVDRLDYSKGIPHKLRAFERLLELNPRLRGKVTLIQLAVPSRVEVFEYERLRVEIDGLVGRINGRFTQAGWVPIHYLYRAISQEELTAFYHTSDVALVTPLKDGMNLVAKEFCAASYDGHGVLILSEFAGAEEALGKAGALIVNPHHIPALASAIRTALTMSEREQASRMAGLRAVVRKQDVHSWGRSFLDELASGGPAASLKRPMARVSH